MPHLTVDRFSYILYLLSGYKVGDDILLPHDYRAKYGLDSDWQQENITDTKYSHGDKKIEQQQSINYTSSDASFLSIIIPATNRFYSYQTSAITRYVSLVFYLFHDGCNNFCLLFALSLTDDDWIKLTNQLVFMWYSISILRKLYSTFIKKDQAERQDQNLQDFRAH